MWSLLRSRQIHSSLSSFSQKKKKLLSEIDAREHRIGGVSGACNGETAHGVGQSIRNPGIVKIFLVCCNIPSQALVLARLIMPSCYDFIHVEAKIGDQMSWIYSLLRPLLLLGLIVQLGYPQARVTLMTDQEWSWC